MPNADHMLYPMIMGVMGHVRYLKLTYCLLSAPKILTKYSNSDSPHSRHAYIVLSYSLDGAYIYFYLMRGSWPTRVSLKRHLGRFSHFFRVPCDQQTDRQTDTTSRYE